jgi:hypothetical protein
VKQLKLNENEAKIIEKALDNLKIVVQIMTNTSNQKAREQAINDLYNIESVEKRLK